MSDLATARVAQLVPPSPRPSPESTVQGTIDATLTGRAPGTASAPLSVAPLPRTARTRRPWWRLPLRGVLGAALVVACADLTALVGAPVAWPVVAVAAVVWPVLLMALGEPGAGRVGTSRSGGNAAVVRAGVIAVVLCWLLHPVAGSTTGPEQVLPFLALLGVTTALGAALRPGARPHRVVLAGSSADVSAAFAGLGPSPGFEVVGVCVPAQQDAEPGPGALSIREGVPVSSGLEDSVDVAADWEADAVVLLPGQALSPTVTRRLLWRAGALDVRAYVATGLLDVAPARTSVLSGTGLGLGLMHVRPAPLRGVRRLLKAAVERSAALLGLLLLAPVLLVVAAAIRRETPGPALFRQERVGRDARLFTMYKLRTMSQGAAAEQVGLTARNECDAVLFKMRSDPRVTRLGRTLRRYSVDELPQLWNVVLGDMALVGPRPALPGEVACYDDDPRRRLAVKPGLTGLWQVSGRSDLSWQESVRLDLCYVDNWSLLLDLRILCRTVAAVLDHRGAY